MGHNLNATLSGTGVPAVTPQYIGQLYTDTVTSRLYVAIGLTVGSWVASETTVQASGDNNFTGTNTFQNPLEIGQGTTDVHALTKGQINTLLENKADLDAQGKVPISQLPATVITSVSVVATEAAQLALEVQVGDVVVRTDIGKSYIALNSNNSTMADWQELLTAGGGGDVLSVNGLTGVVELDADDIDDTSTSHKFVTATDITKLGNVPADTNTALAGKVDVVAGKALSSNDFSDAYKNILDAAAGSQYLVRKATYMEQLISSATGAVNLDIANGPVFAINLTGNVTFTLTGQDTSSQRATSIIVLVQQDATGNRGITWPANVKWMGGTAPEFGTSAGSISIFQLFTPNGGTDWYGSLIGKDLS